MHPGNLVTVIIVNYGTSADAIECVRSVAANRCPAVQIVLIDNNSPDNSVAEIRNFINGPAQGLFADKAERICALIQFDIDDRKMATDRLASRLRNDWKSPNICSNAQSYISLYFLPLGENIGFAGANNVALDALMSSGQDSNILLLNPDVLLGKGALETLCEAASGKREFVYGISVYHRDRPKVLYSAGGHALFKPFGIPRKVTHEARADEIDYIYGAALFTNCATIVRVGTLREEYFLYWEETDWCLSAKRMGIPLRLVPEAVCFDKVGASIGRGYLANYYFSRNALHFYKRNMPYYIPSLLTYQLFRFFLLLARCQPAAARGVISGICDFFRGKYGKL
jgi:GT2 family glycosyltransferase